MKKKVLGLIILIVGIAVITTIIITSVVIVQQAPKSKDTVGTSRGSSQQEKSYGDEIQFKTGAIAPEIKTEAQNDEFLLGRLAQDKSHVVLQFSKPLDSRTRLKLKAADIDVLNSLGSNAFFASIGRDYDTLVGFQVDSLESVSEISPNQKLDSFLTKGKPYPEYAVVADGVDPVIAVYVLFHKDVARGQTVRLAQQYGATIRSALISMNVLVLELSASKMASLAESDDVMWIELALPLLEETNEQNREQVQAQIAQDPPYNLDGSGVVVMVYDGGNAQASHPDFEGRLTIRDSEGLANHATHVSGTIGGNGGQSARGMAPGVTMESYGTLGPLPPGFLYTDPLDIEMDYADAINNYEVVFASNSIGTNAAHAGQCSIQGNYGVTASLIDSIVRGSLGEVIRIIWAGGNELGHHSGDCNQEGYGQYYSTAPPACAKNQIDVGATLQGSNFITDFTSWGPCDDGRMRPDVMATGDQVWSTFIDGYGLLSGTSMAAPTVTGSAALLLEDFRIQFPGRADFLPSTLKVLLAHNALDSMNPGPDYRSGYGLIQITDTIDFMRTDSFLEAEVDQGEIYSFEVNVLPGDSELKATLAWDDYPATPLVIPSLINDLDIIAIDPDGGTHYPWTLDPLDPGADAQRIGPNSIDNIEQVYVENPVQGIWTIEITGTNVPEGPQVFSVAAEPNITESNMPGDVNGDGFVNVLDLIDLLLCFGQPAMPNCEAEDLNGDGVVNVLDMIELLLNFGAGDFPECNDGNDNDLDLNIDSADPGCWIDPGNPDTYDPQDNDESNCGDNVCEGTETNAQCPSDCPIFECNDGVDNDGDEAIDIADLGCENPIDDDESNCGDGICEGIETNVSCFEDCSVPASLLVFVTNTTTTGLLGNNPTDALSNADDICNIDASDNGHPGTYKAWLSTTTENARERIVDGEYRNVFDQVIANDMADLLDGSLINSIHSVGYSIWTGTHWDGNRTSNCNDWSTGSSGPVGKFGRAVETSSLWTVQVAASGCNSNKRLYCFQVS